MKIPELKGCGTALLTPFLEDGEVDYEAFAALVQRQAEGGVDFLVPLGTTAETPTLDPVERVSLLEIAHDCAGGRPLLVGCGSNSVAGTLAQMNMLDGAAVDAWLVVVPFYNKPNQEGQFRYFKAIAEESRKPIVVYNVPGRTGANMLPAYASPARSQASSASRRLPARSSRPGKSWQGRLRIFACSAATMT